MIRDNSDASPHAIASFRPSHRQRRPVIRTAIRHTNCLSVYRFQSPHGFSSTPRRSSFISYHISVSFLVSPYLVSQDVSFLYRLVHTCRIRYTVPSALLTGSYSSSPVSSPGVKHDIAIVPSSSIRIFIVFLYHCILVSFIYIAYIIFIIYINRRCMMSNATIAKQAAAPLPVSSASNRINGTRQKRQPRGQEAGDDEPNGGRRTASRPAAIGR